jgi:hypothetical protein
MNTFSYRILKKPPGKNKYSIPNQSRIDIESFTRKGAPSLAGTRCEWIAFGCMPDSKNDFKQWQKCVTDI